MNAASYVAEAGRGKLVCHNFRVMGGLKLSAQASPRLRSGQALAPPEKTRGFGMMIYILIFRM